MKLFFLGLLSGALIMGASFFVIVDTKPESMPVCEQQEKIIEKIVTQTAECPVTPQADFSQQEEKITQAFLYFLATLGIRENYRAQVEQIVAAPEKVPETVATAQPVSEPQVFLNLKDAQKIYADNEFYRDIREMQPGLKRLEAQILSDPVIYFARAKTIEEVSQIRKINGQYVGKLYRIQGNHAGKVEDVELSIEYYRRKDKKPDGKFTMTIARDGKIYSNMRGEGGNNDIMKHPTSPEQIILRAAPGMYFHFIDERLMQANVYDNGKFIGTSSLQRI